MQIRLLLWGIGQVYNSVINLLKCYENLGQIEIVGITAQELPDFRTLDGYTLVRKEEIQSLDFDYLLVMSDNFYDEIVSSAVSVADVPRSKIVSYRILKIPGFDFPKYDLVKNQRGGGGKYCLQQLLGRYYLQYVKYGMSVAIQKCFNSVG